MEKNRDGPEKIIPGFYPQPIENDKHPRERVYLDLYPKPKDRIPLSLNTGIVQGGEMQHEWAFPPRTMTQEWYASIHLPVWMTESTLRDFLPAIFRMIKTVKEVDPTKRGPLAKKSNVTAASRRMVAELKKRHFCVFCGRGRRPYITQEKNGIKQFMTIATVRGEGQEAFGRIKKELTSQHIKTGMAASSKKPGGRKLQVTYKVWRWLRTQYLSLKNKGYKSEVIKTELIELYAEQMQRDSSFPILEPSTILLYAHRRKYPRA